MERCTAIVVVCLGIFFSAAGFTCEGATVPPQQMVELSIDAPAWLPPGGGDFVVTVGVGEVTNLVGYQIKLDFYDNAALADVFTVLTTTEGELFAGREYCSGDVADGRAGVLLGGGVSGSGSYADFVVRYAPRSRGEYYVSLRAELLDADGRWISWRCDPIAVQVGFGADPTSPPPVADSETLALGHPIPVPGTPLYCDVNGDGFVNILDMMLVNNYFNMEVEGRLRYADVTPDPPDGVINILDMIAVQNRLGFSTPYSADDFEYDPDIKDQFFEWDTRSLLPLVIEVICTISPDVPLVGDIVWRVSSGSVTGATFDPETNVASATILAAGASFEVTVYNRGEIIGEDEVDFDVYTPPQLGHVHVYMYDLSKGLAGLPDRENNEYWGVFGKPEEVMAAEIEYRCNYFPGPTHVHSLTVTWDEALVVDVTFGEDHLANGVPFDDFPDPPDADYNNILSVDIALPDGPSGSVAPNLILADIEGDYGKDPLIYTTCLIEDITAPKLVPWNGWDNMLELSGKPEQSSTDELPDLGAEMLVRMTPSDPLVRLVIDDSDFDGLVLFDDNYEEIFRRISGEYYVPGPDSGTNFSAIMFSTEESAALNDKSITVSYHNPYGYYDDGNPVDSVTSDYTVVRPDIDVDTDGDDMIVEEDDDELELETTICVPLATEWDEMTPAKIALRPATQQLGGEIKLKIEGDGKIRVYEAEEPYDLIMNDDVDEQDVWDFVLSGEDDVLIQGIKAGYVELFLEYTNGGTFRTYDKVKLLVGPDIDIDSDNDNNFDDPERTWDDEEQIEDEDGDPDFPGKIVVVNDGDVDDDGIPDFADGYDRDPADPEDNLCPGLQFVPVILEISEPPDASMWFIYYVKVRLTYDSSDPAQVTKTPEGEYQLPGAPEGSLRLWTEPGADARNKNSAKNSGDFVPGRAAGADANVFDATALGFTWWMKPYVVTLYLEGVKPSATIADKRIKFEVDLDGDGEDYDWTEDAVRVTAAKVTITEAKGLYKKDGTYEVGYKSEDEDDDGNDDGRIYSNRAFDPVAPNDPVWTKNRQYVDFTVSVEPSALSPDYLKISWEAEDPDDPSNEASDVDTDGKPILDPNDYDGIDNDGDGTPDNSDGMDNTGGRDGHPEWEQIAGYALAGNETELDAGLISKVKFNASDHGGDNFIVRPKLKVKAQQPTGGERTGVMTVWKRIDIEYVKMQSADPLPVEGLPAEFARGFAEPRVDAMRPVSDIIVGGKKVMGLTDEQAYDRCSEYVTKAKGEFSKEGPGWFFLSAANEYMPVAEITPEQLYPSPPDVVGDATANGDSMTLLSPLPVGKEPNIVLIYKNDLSKYVLFVVKEGSLSADRKTFEIEKKNYQPVDKPGLGDAVLIADLTDYGVPVGSTIKVRVLSPGAYGVGGISPGLAGKTIIFTGWVEAAGSLDTIVHEMTHAFGLAHKCGNWDHVLGTDQSCAMNYGSWFILDNGTPRSPIPWTNKKDGTHLCAPHAKAIRESNLEDIPGLGW